MGKRKPITIVVECANTLDEAFFKHPDVLAAHRLLYPSSTRSSYILPRFDDPILQARFDATLQEVLRGKKRSTNR